jgi:hypothetical protein
LLALPLILEANVERRSSGNAVEKMMQQRMKQAIFSKEDFYEKTDQGCKRSSLP